MKQLNKVIITKKITNVDEAKAFIDELAICGKIFHFEDDPYDVECFTAQEAFHIDARVTEMFKIKSSLWEEFEDPIGYALYKLNN